jgi:hypothetical protein
MNETRFRIVNRNGARRGLCKAVSDHSPTGYHKLSSVSRRHRWIVDKVWISRRGLFVNIICQY